MMKLMLILQYYIKVRENKKFLFSFKRQSLKLRSSISSIASPKYIDLIIINHKDLTNSSTVEVQIPLHYDSND